LLDFEPKKFEHRLRVGTKFGMASVIFKFCFCSLETSEWRRSLSWGVERRRDSRHKAFL